MAEPTRPLNLTSESHEDHTRRIIVWWVFIQFNVFVFAVLGAMVFKGWELSPSTNSLITLIMGTELGAVSGAVGFYLGGIANKKQ